MTSHHSDSPGTGSSERRSPGAPATALQPSGDTGEAVGATLDDVRFRRVIEDAPVGIVVCDRKGEVLATNRVYREMVGDELGPSLTRGNLVTGTASRLPGFAHWVRTLAGGEPVQFEVSFRPSAGRTVDARVSAKAIRDADDRIIGFQSFVEDRSDRRALEADLSHAARTRAAADLAASVSHEFNNILTVIQSHAHFLRDAGLDRLGLESLNEIQEAVDRAARLTRSLSALRNDRRRHAELIDARQHVRDVARTLDALMGSEVSVRSRVTTGPAWIFVSPGELNQTLIRLALDGRAYAPHSPSVEILLSEVDLRSAPAGARPEPPPGSYVSIRVRTADANISPAAAERLFESAADGPSHGVGLLDVSRFARNAGGSLCVDTAPDSGAVEILLPRVAPPARREALAEVGPIAPARILVVEEDAVVRELIAGLLEADGHEVVTCSDGNEALEVAWQSRDPLDLFIYDLPSRGLSAGEFLEGLRAADVQAAALCVSDIGSADDLPEEALVLAKPFRPEQLQAAVAAALRQGRG